MDFGFTFSPSKSARRRADTPSRLLILGNLRGHPTEAQTPLLERPITRIDIDNVEDVLAQYAPSVVLGAEAGGERLQFRTFADFHPDRLVETLYVFRRLRDLRRRLEHPGTFAPALAELRADPIAGESVAREDPPSPTRTDDESSTFERLLGRNTDTQPATPLSAVLGEVDALIRRIVAPHIVQAADPQVPQLVSAVDIALSDAMRRVLHDPGFQEIEATWRGIQWLVSSLELGEELELHLLHVPREELSTSVGPESDLYRRLVEREARVSGGLQLSALVGHYRFNATKEDLDILESMGSLARAASAPFVAECGASLLGSGTLACQPDPREWRPLDPQIDARWGALRGGPIAAYVGLLLPRFMLRLPYGSRSDPIEAFRFEEQSPTPEHEAFLWGNPAFACAVILARVIEADSVDADAGTITGLPAFVSTTDGEPRLQPCGEVDLTERAVEAILARGIMPVVNLRDRDAVRLVRLLSIADPPAALAG
jgi:type VI secretion system ImpC/EvpB family protein/type VI secretion system ImpB/VipA family protein